MHSCGGRNGKLEGGSDRRFGRCGNNPVSKKKWTAGIILAGVGVAALASEYPEKFEEVRRRMPDFIERGNNFLEVASRVGDRLAEAAGTIAAYELLLS